MLRITTSYLLISIVLMGPHLCLGQAAGVGTCCEVGTCCCGGGHERSGGEPQHSDENKPDCLCRGAILDVVQSAEPEGPTRLAVDWLIDDEVFSAPALALVDSCSEPPHHFPPFSTGRDVCVLSCALLL